MPRARRCADGEYPRCRVVVYRVIGYVLSAVNKLTKQEVRVEREIRARYAELTAWSVIELSAIQSMMVMACSAAAHTTR